jgi:hypothetical protein|tara:strand:- start:2055 stop:2294 length:240 start_codon:yes stop_codon:yes gene_type:complete
MKHITGQSNTTLNGAFSAEDDTCACVSFICTMLTANWMELQRLKKHDIHAAIDVAKQLAIQNTSIVEDDDLWSHKMPTA